MSPEVGKSYRASDLLRRVAKSASRVAGGQSARVTSYQRLSNLLGVCQAAWDFFPRCDGHANGSWTAPFERAACV